jgi:hypothetical protein
VLGSEPSICKLRTKPNSTFPIHLSGIPNSTKTDLKLLILDLDDQYKSYDCKPPVFNVFMSIYV